MDDELDFEEEDFSAIDSFIYDGNESNEQQKDDKSPEPSAEVPNEANNESESDSSDWDSSPSPQPASDAEEESNEVPTRVVTQPTQQEEVATEPEPSPPNPSVDESRAVDVLEDFLKTFEDDAPPPPQKKAPQTVTKEVNNNDRPKQRPMPLSKKLANKASPVKTTPAGQMTSTVPKTASTLAKTNFSESETTSSVPKTTTSMPKTTSSVPKTTTSVSKTTSSMPNTTSSVPKTSTSVPKTTSSVPKTTTSVPKTTSSVPKTTTSVPKTTSSVPKTTTSVTKTTSSVLKTTTSVPKTTSSVPKTTTSVTKTTSSLPKTTSTTPKATLVIPNTTSTLPKATPILQETNSTSTKAPPILSTVRKTTSIVQKTAPAVSNTSSTLSRAIPKDTLSVPKTAPSMPKMSNVISKPSTSTNNIDKFVDKSVERPPKHRTNASVSSVPSVFKPVSAPATTPIVGHYYGMDPKTALDKCKKDGRKTIELDNRYYESMRIYLRGGSIIGYEETSFRQQAKSFKCINKKLYLNDREVIETDERQQEIAIEYHLNAKSKGPRSQHRGVSATTKAIEAKYHWPTVKFDVENAIKKCRFCSPKDYDLTSFQLWKYIEIGVIENLLIVRDLNGKSSLINCSAFDDQLTSCYMADHLVLLFTNFGIPNAIRLVLAKEGQKQFTEELKNFLFNHLSKMVKHLQLLSTAQPEEEITVPSIEIHVEYGSANCPKTENELMSSRVTINQSEDTTVLSIFSVNDWLIPPLVFNDIEKLIITSQGQGSDVKSLTLYFQMTGINVRANEANNETNTQESVNSQKEKKSSQTRELERLQIESKLFDYNNMRTKRPNTPNNLRDDSDSDGNHSNASSRRSSSTKKPKNRLSVGVEKERPFKELSRERPVRSSVETIDIEDSSSTNSILSQNGSAKSLDQKPVQSSLGDLLETRRPALSDERRSEKASVSQKSGQSARELSDLEKYDINGICQPCVVTLTSHSQQYIDDAINGNINFSAETSARLTDNGGEEEVVQIDDSDSAHEATPEPVAVKQTPNHKSKDTNGTKRTKRTTFELNLSESSSPEEEEPAPKVTKKPTQNHIGKANQSVKSSAKSKSRPKRKRKISDDDSDSDYKEPKHTQLDENSDSKDDADSNEDMSAKTPRSAKKAKLDFRTKVKAKMSAKEKWIQGSKNLLIPSSSQSNSDKSGSQSSETNSKKSRHNSKEANKEVVIHRCAHCDFQTNDRKTLVLHSAKHRNIERVAVHCDVCFEQFFSKPALQMHKDESHPPDLRNVILYGCPVSDCKGLQFDTIEATDEHLKTHIEDISFMKTTSKHRCAVCKTCTTKDVDSMEKHLSQKHRSFKCAFDCDYVGSDYQTLERHAKSSHSNFGQPFECKFCEYGSAVFGSLVQHKAKEHAIEWMAADGKNKCGLCENEFAFEDDSIVDHLMDHSMDFEGYLQCTNCGLRCRKLEQMKSHLNTHHGVGPADGFKSYIANIKNLFTDVLKQKLERSRSKQSRSQEMASALAGLEGEEFPHDDYDDQYQEPMEDIASDAVAAALSLSNIDFGDFGEPDPNQEAVTISIPENGEEAADEQNEDYSGFIRENEDGDWVPADTQSQ